MLESNVYINNLNELDNMINKISNIENTKENKLKEFLKLKVKKALEEVMNTRLIGGTTNDELISEYKANNHIEDIDVDSGFGFRIYNNTTIDPVTRNPQSYPYGFSIALAFEYGVGILGNQTPNLDNSAWKYNVHNYDEGWFYPKNGSFENMEFTSGYKGFEIYRYLKDKVEKEVQGWIYEYYERDEE